MQLSKLTCSTVCAYRCCSWIDFCSHELELPATVWVYPVIGYMPYNEAAVNKAKADLAKGLASLEKHLLDKVPTAS